jgi:hypothetical protein
MNKPNGISRAAGRVRAAVSRSPSTGAGRFTNGSGSNGSDSSNGWVPTGSRELTYALEAARSPEERAELWHAYLDEQGAAFEAETAEAAEIISTGSHAEVIEFANRYVGDQAAAENARLHNVLPERLSEPV